MPGETGSEASSQTLALKQIADAAKFAVQSEKERIGETMRLMREAAKNARATASEATIASDTAITNAPVVITKGDLGENRDPVPSRSSEAIAKHGTDDRTPERSPEPIAEQPTARAAQAQSVPIELERRAPEPVTSLPGKKIEQRIAGWCIAVGTALRGPWPDAVWDFYERMTDVATWWRFIKLVLKLLARLFPGCEPRPSRVSKAIREGFRFLHEPAPPWPPQWQPKNPEDPPKAP